MFRSASFFSLLLMFGFLTVGLVSSASAQRSSSVQQSAAARKAEFDRKVAESKKRHEELRKKFAARNSGSKSGASTNQFGHKTEPLNLGYKRVKLNYSTTTSKAKTTSSSKTSSKTAAKKVSDYKASSTPLESLKKFRTSVKRAYSYDQLLFHVSERQKSSYKASQGWGSKFDHLGHIQGITNTIVRYDGYRIKGDTAYVNVIRKSKGTHPYHEGTFTFKGEGGQWKMHEYDDGNLSYSRMPKSK